MTYDEYLKQKIINLYLINQKIGKHSIVDKDFEFLNKYFDAKNNIKPNIYSVSELLQYVISDYKNNLTNKNKIGFDFIEILSRARENADIFLQHTPLSQPQITLEHTQDLKQKYTQIANKYGLKDFYYTLNHNLTPEENYNKAISLLNKTQLELEKLQKTLGIKDSSKIGNNILSIQVNWQEEPQNNGYYNYCSNTICLKDENSTFPLIHEYVHFIDKTTACLLLTGKTSQQLYEEKLFSQKELFDNFDMSVFSKIEFTKENFPWIDEKNYSNKILLKKDIKELLKNKTTSFNFEKKIYSAEEKEIINKTLLFNTFDLTINNSKNWSEEFDVRMNKLYYSTQKEMLARTIEKSVQGNLEQLSDRLTTTTLSQNEQEKFFEIIKSWQTISQEIIATKDKNNISSRISSIRKNLNKKTELISHFKLKS